MVYDEDVGGGRAADAAVGVLKPSCFSLHFLSFFDRLAVD